jgi:electron transport complex protein RnfG
MVQQHFPGAMALRQVSMPEGTQRVGRTDQIVVRSIEGETNRLGYCVESTVAARSGPFRIRVLVDPALSVKQACVLSYAWERGRDVRKPRFTHQFEGKGPAAPLRIGQDIDAMTGATLSSKAMIAGVRDSIALLKTLQ